MIFVLGGKRISMEQLIKLACEHKININPQCITQIQVTITERK